MSPSSPKIKSFARNSLPEFWRVACNMVLPDASVDHVAAAQIENKVIAVVSEDLVRGETPGDQFELKRQISPVYRHPLIEDEVEHREDVIQLVGRKGLEERLVVDRVAEASIMWFVGLS